MKYLFFSLFILITTLSCSKNSDTSITYINSSNINSIIKNKKNLLLFWTTWCGVSKSIITKTYKYLSVDSTVNIIIICGNNDVDGINQLYKSFEIHQKKYIIKNSSNILAIIDRSNIKEFIKENFINSDSLNLTGNFGIPISILVDSNLKIINCNMPQDTLGIKQTLNKY